MHGEETKKCRARKILRVHGKGAHGLSINILRFTFSLIPIHEGDTIMANIIEGNIVAKGLKFGIVASRFNDFICGRLIEGAVDCLVRAGADSKDIHLAKVPGAFEIPLAAKKMAKSGKYDAVICLGAVIRGATPHFEYISAEVSKGIALVGLEVEIPVVFGVITSDTIEQAIERAGSKSGNKGWDAALTAIEMVNLFKKL
jgi:6,7-dimethyl-8-ribityllumazine synthase